MEAKNKKRQSSQYDCSGEQSKFKKRYGQHRRIY